jgi:hypothetical protein
MTGCSSWCDVRVYFSLCFFNHAIICSIACPHININARRRLAATTTESHPAAAETVVVALLLHVTGHDG